MKINFFVAAICLIAAVLLGYLTYSIAHGDEYDVFYVDRVILWKNL